MPIRDETPPSSCPPSSSDTDAIMKPADAVTCDGGEELGSSGSTSGATAGSCGTTRKNISRRTLALRSNAVRWRNNWSTRNRLRRSRATANSNSSTTRSTESPTAATATVSNNQMLGSSDSSSDLPQPHEGSTFPSRGIRPLDFNISTHATTDEPAQEEPKVQASQPRANNDPFFNLRNLVGNRGEDSQKDMVDGSKHLKDDNDGPMKPDLANVIEKAILDFCSSRTVETMRRTFAGVTSEMGSLQGEAARQGDKSVQAPHPVTSELVKEGIVIGNMDVLAPRVHREYRLEMKDSLVEGFLTDAGLFRSICYRTKCQLEVTRRLLNRKLCTGGRWVKYLIVRIIGPTQRAITCCDQLLQKAVPAFKNRIDYPKAAYCRMFFREDIPDNTLLYSCYQRTAGTSNRYGALRLETPYRSTVERTVGRCPWKSGAFRVGKLSFGGAGGHRSMQQIYPGYGYTSTTPVDAACKGVEAVHRIEQMHYQFVANRQLIMQDRRTMTIPVCR